MDFRSEHATSAGKLLRQAGDLERFSRRKFLFGSTAATALAVDMLFTQHVQRQRQVHQVLPVSDDFADTYHRQASWFLFPGYKTSWEEGQWILNSLRGALNRRGRLAAVGYSNLGLDIDKIVTALIEYVREQQLTTLYFYGHSFGGMVATQVAARLRELHNTEVAFILLDSSPHSRADVLDQTWFDGVVFLYESGVRVPSVVRGSYELGERIVHKDERTWRQILDQAMSQLSPIAPSSVLVQSQSAYIYHFSAAEFAGRLGNTRMAFIGNPQDETVRYHAAKAGWLRTFPSSMESMELQTEGARPAHASPGWNPFVYRPLVAELQDRIFPVPNGGSRVTVY